MPTSYQGPDGSGQFRGLVYQKETIRAPRIDLAGIGWNSFDPLCDAFVFSGCDGFQIGGRDPYRETGGYMSRFHILTETGGGVALSFRGKDGSRPGRYRFNDITIGNSKHVGLVGSEFGWDIGLNMDGSEFQKVNESGLREMYFDRLRVVNCDEYAVFCQWTTHQTFNQLQVEPVGTNRQIVRFENCKHLFITNPNVFGTMEFSNCSNVQIIGGFVSKIVADKGNRGLCISSTIVQETCEIENGATGRFNGFCLNGKPKVTGVPMFGSSTFQVVS